LASIAVDIKNLTKTYPKVKAVDDLTFSIEKGEIFGLLGPNGAGKTTTIRMLLTLVKPTSGQINIFGTNALKYPDRIRQMAGYVPQDVSVDSELTGRENLVMYARLYGVPRKEMNQRIKEVLEFLDLTERIGDMVNTYSGGMMRKLEIAQALVNRPSMVYLDEPSIGLDPGAKYVIWELVKKLRDNFNTTILLTTHDMHEADSLCDRIGIMDQGKLVIIDKPSALKSTVGGDVLTLASNSPGFAAALSGLGYQAMLRSGTSVDLLVSNGERLIPQIIEGLAGKGINIESVSLNKPTLDDVFLKYTGTRMDEREAFMQARRDRRTFRRFSR
jgi:ABC-2 type transport system ATP-binding protein